MEGAVEIWLVTAACAAGHYFWRGLGVALSGRITVNSELFNWATCVAYAMIAGLVMRIMIFPAGMLAESELIDRLAACVLALAAFYGWRRNLFVGVSAGAVVLTLASWARTMG
jgi:branched-subunit amino acid transport protein